MQTVSEHTPSARALSLKPYDPSAIAWVLQETSHPGNIGSVCRALFCMGFDQLNLVNPRFSPAKEQADAVAYAGHALHLLQNAQEFAHLNDAIASSDLTIAFTLRQRKHEPPKINIDELPRVVAEHLAQGGKKISLLFGNERTGLLSEHIGQCDLICSIPVATPDTSLNLAQAVQIVAYELGKPLVSHDHIHAQTPIQIADKAEKKTESDELATSSDLNGMMDHWQQALLHIGFIDPEQPKFLMERLSLLFHRSRMTRDEVNLLRGIAKKTLKS